MKEKKPTADNVFLFISGFSAVVLYLAVPYIPAEYGKFFFHELGVFESLTAICYLSGLLICANRISKKSTISLTTTMLWCFLCFVFFGEETSWLQHYLQYATPSALLEENLQNEFNFHNLDFFTTGSWHSAFENGQLDASLLLGTQNLFRLGFFSYFLLLPLLVRFVAKKGLQNLREITPKMNLSATIFIAVTFSFAVYFISPEQRNSITEIREFFYAFFILFYVYFYLGKPRKTGISNSSQST